MATSTISNTVTDPSGVAVASCPVTVTLMPSGGFRSDTFTEVARTVSTTTNASGFWSLALERNTNITPANTYYEVVEQIPDARGGRRVWAISVGASNQSVLAALVTPPPAAASTYLTQASADARYQALGSLGSGTPTTVDAGDTGTAGVATSASRADHEHPVSITSAQLVPAAWLAAWTSYTPTDTNVTVGNGTRLARYLQIGKTVHFMWDLTFGSTTAFTGTVNVGLPVAPAATGRWAVGAFLLDSGTQTYGWVASITSGTSVAVPTSSSGGGANATTPFTWTTNDRLTVSGTYEAT